MKAITLWQPWAQLVALRAKRFETRCWKTHYRGPLAIHAALEFSAESRALCCREPFSTALLGNEDLPLGCVIAICDLAAVFPTSPDKDALFAPVQHWPQSDLPFGDFSPGRYAWQLENVRALEVPIPARGAQGFWHWDEAALGLHAANQHLMKTASQYRQGDVLIERIKKLPAKLTTQAPDKGRIVLAHGEVTGHAHAFDIASAVKLTSETGQEFFEIKGRTIQTELPLLRRWKNQVMVQHPTLGVLEFAVADVEVRGERVLITGDFGLLQHDEHATQAIPAGFYRGAGTKGTVRQREYSPEEIRTVAD